MNCANHPEIAATAYCRTCGKPLCQSCQRPAQGTVFCDEHAVVQAASPASGYSPYTSPYTAPASSGPSPGLAFLLGLIPGVGAIYNAQYVKGFVHVVVLGLLISIGGSGAFSGDLGPLFGLLIAMWFPYMAFEAYHTAAKRQRGEAVDEFSSILPLRPRSKGFPVGPVLLIAIGIVFLLETMQILRLYQIMKYWPVFLIALGCYMLYVRLRASDEEDIRAASMPERTGEEVGNER
jgi:hypothetical protein